MRAVVADWENQQRRKVVKKILSKESQPGGLSPYLGQAAWGFVATDTCGRVEGLTDVYAAGDMTTCPINRSPGTPVTRLARSCGTATTRSASIAPSNSRTSEPWRRTLLAAPPPTKRTPPRASRSATNRDASAPNTASGVGSGLTNVTPPSTRCSAAYDDESEANSYSGKGHVQPDGTANTPAEQPPPPQPHARGVETGTRLAGRET